jgi:urocanate hydratase
MKPSPPPREALWQRAWRGKFVLTGGMGGMGGAQPLAATLNGAAMLCRRSVDPAAHRFRRLRTGLPATACRHWPGARRLGVGGRSATEERSAALGGSGSATASGGAAGAGPNGASCRTFVTDQTSRPRSGERLSCRRAWTLEQWEERLRVSDPTGYVERAAMDSMAAHVQGDARAVPTQRRGGRSTTATTSASMAVRIAGVSRRVRDSPASCRPTSGRCSAARQVGPFRWAALSGEAEDIFSHRRQRSSAACSRRIRSAGDHWLRHGAGARAVPGPAGAHLLGGLSASATRLGLALNRNGGRAAELKAPIVIGRDHLDCGSVASPYRETEALRDGSRTPWPTGRF